MRHRWNLIKDLTGEQFVRGAVADRRNTSFPTYRPRRLHAPYTPDRFWDCNDICPGLSQLPLPRLANCFREINVPCQIIVGLHDPFVPVSNAEGLHRGLPKSKLTLSTAATLCGKTPRRSLRQAYLRLH